MKYLAKPQYMQQIKVAGLHEKHRWGASRAFLPRFLQGFLHRARTDHDQWLALSPQVTKDPQIFSGIWEFATQFVLVFFFSFYVLILLMQILS